MNGEGEKDQKEELSIRTVALRAGVSIATVSRVINGYSRVAAQTRQRVELAMRDLKYAPDQRARALSLGRTDTIGLVLPDLYGDYFGDLMQGIDDRARQADLYVMVSRAVSPEDEYKISQRLLGGRLVDGLVLLLSRPNDILLDHLAASTAPVIVLDIDVGHRRLDNILMDNRTGAHDATLHLLERHRLRRLAFVGGPMDNIDTQDRAAGFKDALCSHDIAPQAGWFFYGEAYDYTAGYAAAERIANSFKGEPIGVIAANDDLAHGLMEGFAEIDLRVPRDVAIVGYDDSRVARLTRPPLTTVQVPLREIGSMAIDMLLERRSGRRKLHNKSIFKGDLVIRKSCGCNP